jgi:hypothetical protein
MQCILVNGYNCCLPAARLAAATGRPCRQQACCLVLDDDVDGMDDACSSTNTAWAADMHIKVALAGCRSNHQM